MNGEPGKDDVKPASGSSREHALACAASQWPCTPRSRARAGSRRYRPGWLRGDVVAGITLAAYLLPAGLGDASLANLPPEAGLYACLFGGLVFWLFCSSRHTAITVTSAISLLVGASLGDIAGGDTTRFGALAAGTALLVALIAFIAWLVKAGSIVNFISESVMVGFKCGVALFLASTQLPKLFGIHGAHGNFWENSGNFLKHLGETNPAVARPSAESRWRCSCSGRSFSRTNPWRCSWWSAALWLRAGSAWKRAG